MEEEEEDLDIGVEAPAVEVLPSPRKTTAVEHEAPVAALGADRGKRKRAASPDAHRAADKGVGNEGGGGDERHPAQRSKRPDGEGDEDGAAGGRHGAKQPGACTTGRHRHAVGRATASNAPGAVERSRSAGPHDRPHRRPPQAEQQHRRPPAAADRQGQAPGRAHKRFVNLPADPAEQGQADYDQGLRRARQALDEAGAEALLKTFNRRARAKALVMLGRTDLHGIRNPQSWLLDVARKMQLQQPDRGSPTAVARDSAYDRGAQMFRELVAPAAKDQFRQLPLQVRRDLVLALGQARLQPLSPVNVTRWFLEQLRALAPRTPSPPNRRLGPAATHYADHLGGRGDLPPAQPNGRYPDDGMALPPPPARGHGPRHPGPHHPTGRSRSPPLGRQQSAFGHHPGNREPGPFLHMGGAGGDWRGPLAPSQRPQRPPSAPSMRGLPPGERRRSGKWEDPWGRPGDQHPGHGMRGRSPPRPGYLQRGPGRDRGDGPGPGPYDGRGMAQGSGPPLDDRWPMDDALPPPPLQVDRERGAIHSGRPPSALEFRRDVPPSLPSPTRGAPGALPLGNSARAKAVRQTMLRRQQQQQGTAASDRDDWDAYPHGDVHPSYPPDRVPAYLDHPGDGSKHGRAALPSPPGPPGPPTARQAPHPQHALQQQPQQQPGADSLAAASLLLNSDPMLLQQLLSSVAQVTGLAGGAAPAHAALPGAPFQSGSFDMQQQQQGSVPAVLQQQQQLPHGLGGGGVGVGTGPLRLVVGGCRVQQQIGLGDHGGAQDSFCCGTAAVAVAGSIAGPAHPGTQSFCESAALCCVQLMDSWAQGAAVVADPFPSLKSVMLEAHTRAAASASGAATLLLMALDQPRGALHIAKVGDVGCVVLRPQLPGSIRLVAELQPSTKAPNGTAYLTSNDLVQTLGGGNALEGSVDAAALVQAGDVVVAATGGFFNAVEMRIDSSMSPFNQLLLQYLSANGPCDPIMLAEAMVDMVVKAAGVQQGSWSRASFPPGSPAVVVGFVMPT